MSLKRLKIEQWHFYPGIDAYDQVIDFSSMGLWITIKANAAQWNIWTLIWPTPDHVPATIDGSPGHIIIDMIEPAADAEYLRLFIRVKFYTYQT